MSRSILCLSASFLVLAACQPAEEAAIALEAEAPPVVVEETAPEEVVEIVAEAAETEAPVEAEDHDDVEDHDEHDHDEDHGEDEAHDHDDHDEHEDHAEHDHEEEDHDHAGGEAHVHGLSELAVSLDASTVSISLEGALANFSLDETLRELEDTTPYTDGLVALNGGECTRDSASAAIRPIGDHGNLMIDLVYTCAAMDTLTSVDVIGFQNFPAFEEVKAVVLTSSSQTGETLTGSDTVLDLP